MKEEVKGAKTKGVRKGESEDNKSERSVGREDVTWEQPGGEDNVEKGAAIVRFLTMEPTDHDLTLLCAHYLMGKRESARYLSSSLSWGWFLNQRR